MKNKNFAGLLSFLFVAAAVVFASCSSTKKVVQLEPSDISQMVANHQFIFVADRMNPLRGPQRTLNAYYDVKVNQDTLKSFLPFFGRAYSPIIDPSKGPLRFDSKDFTYTVSQGRNDSYEITIKPKDVSEVQSLFFTIFNNATATLNVTSTNRDAISFYGHLQPVD